MIINEWEPSFAKNHGHIFPDTYLCIDAEYTGGDERQDLIVELGHVMVQNNQIIDRMNVVLDWSSHKEISEDFVRYKLDNIQSHMGSDWRVTWDVMRSEGMSPVRAFRFYYRLFKTWHSRELPFVAHNGRKAEERMLRGNFNRFINKPFFIHQNQLWDTGALFKATHLHASQDVSHDGVRWKSLPKRSDSLKSYFERVLNCRAKGLYWNLKHCLQHYDLLSELGDEHRFHRAEDDAYCSHLLMQKYGSQVVHRDVEEDAVEYVDDELARILEEAPRQPSLVGDIAEVFSSIPMAPPNPLEVLAEVSEVVKQPKLEEIMGESVVEPQKRIVPLRPQPLRSRKRGQRVI